MTEKQEKISYDPDADVLWWELNEKPISYAREIGGVVVHFSEGHIPVLIEVLEAGRYTKGKEKGELPLGGTAPAMR